MEKFLVVIDTTNRPNAKSLPKDSIQNFYFILAPDANIAKDMVLRTFASKPQLLAQLVACTTATPVNSILNLLSPASNAWSYIPLGNVRGAPGQQRNAAALIPKIRDGEEFSHRDYQPPVPASYEGQIVKETNISGLSAADAAVLRPASTAPAAIDMSNPNAAMAQMQAMMLQMQAMMAAQAGIAPAASQPVKFLKADEVDSETLARIRSNIGSPLETVEDVGTNNANPFVDPDLLKPE